MEDGFADSTVLAHVLTLLNKRHDYGLDLFLLSIDEGIAGYRDDSLETVKRNETQVCTWESFFFSFPGKDNSANSGWTERLSGYWSCCLHFGYSMESLWRSFHTRHCTIGPWTKLLKKLGSRTTALSVVYFAARWLFNWTGSRFFWNNCANLVCDITLLCSSGIAPLENNAI